MDKLKKYPRFISCSFCLIPVEAEPNEMPKTKTLKSWQVICCKCIREITNRIKKIERRVKQLEK
ncbi:MAG: hypothetical protein AABY22_06655 [Nanoarchaeota archaeon]